MFKVVQMYFMVIIKHTVSLYIDPRGLTGVHCNPGRAGSRTGIQRIPFSLES